MIESLWYGRGAGPRAARALLAPLSAAFAAGAALRAVLYERGVLASAGVTIPVVSVGGLSVGGAGKTPFVIWLVARLRALGLKPCVLMRGYAGKATRPLLLSDTDASWPADTVDAAGEEAVLVALRSGAPVAVAPDRVAAARLALAGADCDVFVLDDGFQHRRLSRDLDVVLVDGGECDRSLLPAGPLREKVSALARADFVVATSPAATGEDFVAALAAAGKGREALVSMRLRAVALVSSPRVIAGRGGAVVAPPPGDDAAAQRWPHREAPGALRGLRVGAVAAIARPERLVVTLEAAGATVADTLFLRDHHHYGAADWRRIGELARHCELVVTTEKDMVKLARFAAGAEWLRALRVEAEVEGEGALVARIAGFDRKGRPAHHPPTLQGQ